MPYSRPEVAMSMHAAIMRRGINVLSSIHGESLRYTHPNGATLDFVAISIGNARDTIVRDDQGERAQFVRNVTLRRDPTHIAGGVANIVHGGKLTIDGEVWSILSIPHESETSVQVTVGRDEVLEASRSDYRRS